jgi:hypothetical protein
MVSGLIPLGKQISVACDLGSMKFKLQFAVKIEPQSIPACFNHRFLPLRMAETGLSGLHKLNTFKLQSTYHEVLGKSGLEN